MTGNNNLETQQGEENSKNNTEAGKNNAETTKNKKPDFDFRTAMDNFIEEKKLEDFLSFEDKNIDVIWADFMTFLRLSHQDSHESIKGFLEGNSVKYRRLLAQKIVVQSDIWKQNFLKTQEFFSDEYNFSPVEKIQLENAIKNGGYSIVMKLLKSQGERRKLIFNVVFKGDKNLLIQNLKKNIQDDQEKLEAIFQTSLLDTFLNDVTKKTEAEKIILNFFEATPIIVSDMLAVLGLFTQEGQAKLLQYFFKQLSLEDLQKIGVLDDAEIEEYILELPQVKNLLSNEKKDLLASLKKDNSLSEIFVPLNDALFQGKNIDLTQANALIQSLVNDLNEMRKNTLLEEIHTIQNREDMFQALALEGLYTPSEIADLKSKFSTGNYMEIISKNTGEKMYFYIKNFASNDPANDTSFDVVDVTYTDSNNNTGVGIDRQDHFGETNYLYTVLFNLLKDKKLNLSVFTPQDLQAKNLLHHNTLVNGFDGLCQKLQDAYPETEAINKLSENTLGNYYLKFKGGLVFMEVKNGSIHLSTGDIVDNTSEAFTQFLQAISDNKCELLKKVDDAQECVQKIKAKNEKIKDFYFQGDHFSPHEAQAEPFEGDMFLITKDGKQSIRIEDASASHISFIVADYDEKKSPPEFGKNKKNATNWTYTEFYEYMGDTQYQVKADSNKETHDHHHGEHLHQHGSLISKIMKLGSLHELGKAVHTLTHEIEHFLETGNELRSAQFALMLGKFIPHQGIRGELQATVEKKEKETVNSIKDKLQGVDSKVMIPQIIHILEDKDAPSYEVEAAMFAVLKYGGLYPKELAKYRGSNAWFYKLGGTDADIKSITKYAKSDDPDVVITEEILVNGLLAMQAKGHNGIKRRSKIHKEFGKEIQAGISAENGDGERESGLRMTLDGRIKYAMGEMSGGTYAHAIGCFENIIKKGPDPAWKLNTIPFVLMAGEVTMNIDQSLINKVKKFGATTPYSQLVLSANPQKLAMYNKYVERVIELKFSTTGPGGKKENKMLDAYKKIMKLSNTKRVSVAAEFWKEYGEKLYPVINMNDGFVISQKDKLGNELLGWYYGQISGLHHSADFSPSDDHIKEGFYSPENSPVVQTGALIDEISLVDRGYFKSDLVRKIARDTLDYLHSVMKSDLSVDDKKAIFKDIYPKIERKIYSKIVPYRSSDNIGNDNGANDWYKTYEPYTMLKEYELDLFNNIEKDFQGDNKESAKKKMDSKYNEFLDKQFDSLLEHSQGGEKKENNVQAIQFGTQKNLEEVLKSA